MSFGVVGELPEAVPTLDYLREAGRRLRVGALRHSRIVHERVRRVAVCTGAGGRSSAKPCVRAPSSI